MIGPSIVKNSPWFFREITRPAFLGLFSLFFEKKFFSLARNESRQNENLSVTADIGAGTGPEKNPVPVLPFSRGIRKGVTGFDIKCPGCGGIFRKKYCFRCKKTGTSAM